MRLMAWAVVTALMLGAASSAVAQSKPFKTFEGGFSVQLPEEPSYKTKKLGKSAIVQHQFLCESKDGKIAHMAAYHIDAGLVGLNNEQKQQVLIETRDAIKDMFKGEIVIDKAVDFAGNPGREFKATIPKIKSEIRVRAYIVGDRFYQVMVVGPREVADSTDTEAFLDSFKLLTKKRK